jgi:predicted pyridoxine 5'-phosphate oxidase superfamily flavin-nucleotide-binding protein
MTKFTQDMKDIAAKADPFVLATASKSGKPNGVPIGLVKIISDDEIMLVDNFMNKTRQNIDENPMVAVTFWSMKDLHGYQFKGKARVETSGKLFDEAIQWVENKPKPSDLKNLDSKPKPKAIVVVKVEEIYYVGPGKNSTRNLA